MLSPNPEARVHPYLILLRLQGYPCQIHAAPDGSFAVRSSALAGDAFVAFSYQMAWLMLSAYSPAGESARLIALRILRTPSNADRLADVPRSTASGQEIEISGPSSPSRPPGGWNGKYILL